MPPKVSVIIPAYHHEDYVGLAIESVLGQTIDDLELVVIDDASPDATWEVIQGYRDRRIRTFRHHQNQGAVKTLNEGLSLAGGEYLTILNSDDLYHPGRLEALLEAVREEGAEFVSTDVVLIGTEGEAIREEKYGWLPWFENLKDIYRREPDPLLTFFSGNLAVSTSNMFFPATVFHRIGPFREYRYAHDYEFLLRYLADPAANYLFLDGQPLWSYRWHGSNTITESFLAMDQEVFDILAACWAEFAPAADCSQAVALVKRLGSIQAGITAQYRQENEDLRSRLEALHHSRSFRLGRTLLAPARWLKSSSRKLREGWKR